ncbi:MAG: hypothetical protein JWQ57_2952, partial [Mucilaginibacter sp.]|nr:hypothetical protein [Mucilaginibacter sp.]
GFPDDADKKYELNQGTSNVEGHPVLTHGKTLILKIKV